MSLELRFLPENKWAIPYCCGVLLRPWPPICKHCQTVYHTLELVEACWALGKNPQWVGQEPHVSH